MSQSDPSQQTEAPGNQEEMMVVTLSNEKGESFQFAVLQAFEFDGGNYLLAMPENSQDQLVVIERQGDNLSLVRDEARLQQLQGYLDQLASEMQSVTLTDQEGNQYQYQIVHQLELDGQTYLLGLEAGNQASELVAFRAKEDGIELVTEEALLQRIQDEMQSTPLPGEALKITLETPAGEKHDFTIVGRLEIQGQEYLLATSEQGDEHIALRFDGENLSLVEDEAEQELVNQHLLQLRQAQQAEG